MICWWSVTKVPAVGLGLTFALQCRGVGFTLGTRGVVGCGEKVDEQVQNKKAAEGRAMKG